MHKGSWVRGKTTAVALAIALIIGVLAFAPRPATAATAGVITSSGPLTKITTSTDLGCAVNYAGDSHGEFYDDTACGTFVAIGNTTYGPATIPAGPKDPGTTGYKKFTPVSQSVVSGAGTASNPYKVTTVVDAGTSKVRVTQTDTYVVGQQSYRTDIALENKALSSTNVVVYRAGDCYVNNDDRGFGQVDTATGAVSCVGATTSTSGAHTPNSRLEQWLPVSSGSKYLEGPYNTVWSAVLGHNPFPSTCQCATYLDNGAGLSWSISLGALATTTRSQLLTFSPIPLNPLTTSSTADAASVSPGGTVGYTISIANPNTVGTTLTSFTDDLPSGFTYQSGSTTGATALDPVVTNNGRHLQWSGQFPVNPNGASTLHFRATSATIAGDYFNNAGGAATGNTTVMPSGDTAVVRVLGPASLTIAADRPSAPAGPSAVPTSDIPLQPNSPAIQSAPLMKLALLSSPLLKLALLSSPLMKLALLSSPLLKLALLSSPLMKLALLSSPFGFDSLGNSNDLGGSALVKTGLSQLPLSSMPVIEGDDWPTRLAGTGLESRPLATLTFGDVLASNIAPDKMPSLSQLDLSQGPLGRLTSVSLYMGDTRLSAMGGVDWCTQLEHLGYADCGAALGVPGSADKGKSASLLSLEISGVALDNLPGLKTLKLGDVRFPANRAVLPAVTLSSMDLNVSSLGGILARTATNVVDCTKVDCSATSVATLYTAKQQGALSSSATIADLGAAATGINLIEAITGLTTGDASENPLNLPPDQLGVLGYGGANPVDVHYTVNFTSPNPLTSPALTVTLPSQFRFVPGTSLVKLDGAPMTAAPTPTDNNEKVVWDFAGTALAAGKTLTITFAARPGLAIGAVNTTATIAAGTFALNAATSAPLNVVEAFENGDAITNTTPLTPGSIYFSHISHPGDVDYYTFSAPAGSRINVYLTQGDSDADLVLYHPASARPHVALRPPASLPAIQAAPDRPLTLGNQGEPLDPSALNDIAIADLPLAGVSGNRGLTADSVQATAWDAPAGAKYTVQVGGYNGAFGSAAYGLRVAITPALTNLPVGNARVLPHDADATRDTPANPSDWAGTKTLVIADRQRLRRAFGDDRANVALDALSRLEGAGIGARTLFVDGFADVNAAMDALDARPSDPELSNDVVRAINARVDATLGAARDGVQHIVLVGSDEVLPMSRVPDLTATANERSFAQELLDLGAATGGNNALLGAAANGMILSDDAYGAFHPVPFLGTYLYTPDVALGRLVESPEDIASVVNQYLTPAQQGDAPGVLRPQKSLVTGYDFMTALAKEVKSTLNTDVTPAQVQSLISETWTRSDFTNAFTGATPIPDIISANAHYSPNALLPAAHDGTFTTGAFGGSTPPDIARRILFQMGCHSGFSISNFLAPGGDTSDWPEAMLGRGVAAFVGNTGFGIGLRDTVAFSGRITGDFAKNLAHMPLGTALAQAKRDYAGGGTPNVYDYKVMAEATYFGLPMFHLPGATDGPAPAPPRPTVTDATTGFTAVDVRTSQPTTSSNWQLQNNGEGSYWQLAPQNQFAVAPNSPIQPKLTFDVTQPGLEARGAFLTRLSSVDERNFDPALARVVVGQAANEHEVSFGDIHFPTAQQGVIRSQTPGGARDQLVLIPAHFESTLGTNPVTGVESRFTNMDARVFYADASNTDRTPPVFSNTSVIKNGSTASFKVVVADRNGGSVRDVTVLFNDGSSPDWTFRHLALASDGTWVGGFPVTGTGVQFIAQAVDAAGNVGLTTNKGDFFDYANRASGTPDVTADINGAGANGWYQDGTNVTLTGPTGETFDVSDNGGPVSTWSSGQPIPVRGSGVHTLHFRSAPGGATGDITVPVDTAAPTISGAPTTAANAAGWYKAPVTVHFDCTDVESGVATCEPDRTITTEGSGQSVTGRGTDNVGNSATATVGGINIDSTAPTIGGSATSAPNAAGWYNGPVTVHFTCSDDRSGIATCPADQTLSTDGSNQSVTGTAVDAAGNTAAYTVSGINIDATAPVLTGTPDRAANPAGWYRSAVTINFSCGDGAGSGVATCAPAQTLTNNGSNQSVTATVVDRAGNSTTITVGGINIDTGLPTITGAPDRAPNAAGWYNSPVTVSFTCADAVSGVASCQNPVTLASEGTNQTVSGAAVDVAGNTNTANVTGLNIDRTPPTITATPNDNTWRKGSVTVHFTCADERSGVVSCPADVVVSASGATDVTRTVTDKAGNTTSITVVVHVDNGPPSSTFDGSGLIVALPTGPISGTATDDYSGIASLTVKFVNNLTRSTTTSTATITCAEPRTSCRWTVKAPTVVGSYKATAIAVDRAGNAQNPGTLRDVSVLS